ncbi:CHAT domain-containing protein [Sphingomonas sp. MG17]|uniref:CHAT domain-containing protein n=1 Tax=Sphingomonas tagetis TaxID=2949092 RepID=A0A9X2HMU5_9SPHN|nr:CHAT domain-containing protein [Sphingomonas tagetis]MCP3730233.1 CHAT domain-containing protein [Sphingomonas tagetis]
MPPLSRRRFFAVSAAAAALGAAPAALAQPDPLLHAAIRSHLGYSVGFRRKFGTGLYAMPGTAAPVAKVLSTHQAIVRRLATLSADTPTLALLHWLDEQSRLHAWLIGAEGVVARGTAGSYTELGFVLSALRVDVRTATRAPVKRGVPRIPPRQSDAALSPEAALVRTRDLLLPGDIGRALADRRGRLLILPARDTGAAPYAALPLGEAMFVDRWASVIVPDIETLADPMRVFSSEQLRPGNALLVGNPDLSADTDYEWRAIPAAEEEVAAFARMFAVPPHRVLTGRAATRDRVLAAIDNYGEASIVYLATHGVANSVNPMDGSFLALSGGHLFGRDLRGKRFEAWAAWHPLVILSACQTALGKTFDGGTYGVARGWISAGAGQVIASLWNVDDNATRALMVEFAGHAFVSRKLPEEALRLAQLAARASFPADPAAWASFSVFGAPATA